MKKFLILLVLLFSLTSCGKHYDTYYYAVCQYYMEYTPIHKIPYYEANSCKARAKYDEKYFYFEKYTEFESLYTFTEDYEKKNNWYVIYEYDAIHEYVVFEIKRNKLFLYTIKNINGATFEGASSVFVIEFKK